VSLRPGTSIDEFGIRPQSAHHTLSRRPHFQPCCGVGHFGAIPEIKRYQVRQTGPRDLLILITPGSGWSPASEEAIHRGLQERLGNAFRYDILAVDEIRLAPSGKFQTVIPPSPSAAGSAS
jgi:hypothetical protein